jgi:hypothetical protein
MTPAQNSVNSGTKSNEADKLDTMIGTGKDFDALVTTLKMAIERGDIDKENVHRLAHGLGVKPDTLASMIGVGSKDNIKAEDQDDSPKNEVSPPDLQKNFKDFRLDTQAATPVTEAVKSTSSRMSSTEINNKIKQIRMNGRRAGKKPNEINSEIQAFRRLQSRSGGGSTNPVSLGQQFASSTVNMESDPMIQRRLRQLRNKRN